MADFEDKKDSYRGSQFLQEKVTAAALYLKPEQRSMMTSLIQAPFTGTYTSQSGQIVGMFKNMRDTFKSNLADLEKQEKVNQDSYDGFMDVKTKAWDKMHAQYEQKQGLLANNDDEMAAKNDQLKE